MKVVVPHHNFTNLDIEREVLGQIDADVTYVDETDPDDIIAAAVGADAILTSAAPDINGRVINNLDELKVISRFGIGVDNIDLDTAAERGVVVTNVPTYCLDELSTHTIALLFTVVRNIRYYDMTVRAGKWDWKHGRPIYSTRGKTLGFVAFGKIPQRVIQKLDGFDLDYIAFDPYNEEEIEAHGVESVSFDELLDRSDYLSIHTPLTDETERMFGTEEFESMKESSIIVNTARGEVVDESALFEALRSGKISGAGLDVMEMEPPEGSPLFELNNIVITPHVGFYSEDSHVKLRRTAAENVKRVLLGKKPRSSVENTKDGQ